MVKRFGIIFILLICLISVGIISYMKFYNTMSSNSIVVNNQNNSEVKVSSVQSLDGKAKIIKDVWTTKKMIALSFEGIQDDETMEQILDLLKFYNIKSTFIIPGIDCAENPEIIKEIKGNGHELGSGTLSSDTKEMENLSKEELIKNFSKSNNIMEGITLDKGRYCPFCRAEQRSCRLSLH